MHYLGPIIDFENIETRVARTRKDALQNISLPKRLLAINRFSPNLAFFGLEGFLMFPETISDPEMRK